MVGGELFAIELLAICIALENNEIAPLDGCGTDASSTANGLFCVHNVNCGIIQLRQSEAATFQFTFCFTFLTSIKVYENPVICLQFGV